MELANIEQLIKKYENAETTLQEEQVLKDYFQHNNVPGHLIEYKAYFNYFTESSAERFTKTIPLKPRKMNWKWLSIAALVVVMVSIYSINQSRGLSEKDRLEAVNAYQETQKALQLISKNLNKGEHVAVAGLQEFGKAQHKIFKTTKK
ncbi:MAG TPA: hypothetical protein ENK46_01400 [Flavobacteriia bacterium]|jgi:hypothetical protein|nr:hypothetical protein [Flavobacteriia bacterium]